MVISVNAIASNTIIGRTHPHKHTHPGSEESQNGIEVQERNKHKLHCKCIYLCKGVCRCVLRPRYRWVCNVYGSTNTNTFGKLQYHFNQNQRKMSATKLYERKSALGSFAWVLQYFALHFPASFYPPQYMHTSLVGARGKCTYSPLALLFFDYFLFLFLFLIFCLTFFHFSFANNIFLEGSILLSLNSINTLDCCLMLPARLVYPVACNSFVYAAVAVSACYCTIFDASLATPWALLTACCLRDCAFAIVLHTAVPQFICCYYFLTLFSLLLLCLLLELLLVLHFYSSQLTAV